MISRPPELLPLADLIYHTIVMPVSIEASSMRTRVLPLIEYCIKVTFRGRIQHRVVVPDRH